MLKSLFSKKAVSDSSLVHDDFFNELRVREYQRIDKEGHVYLDYTGGNIHSDSQLRQHFDLLRNNVFGNPHSTNPTSQLATKLVDEARAKVISFFNADDYFAIFTQNASGALKMIGECYPFNETAQYLLFADNHNSVNGIREYAKLKGAEFEYVPIQYEDLQVNEEYLTKKLKSFPNKKDKLFAYPAQSNVSGVKHNLEWIKTAQAEGWDVLLDAAAYVPTSKLDLKEAQPDFVSISFYKIFGYPTGLGCLLVKKSKFDKLQKPWFAGGTVSLAAVMSPNHYLIENHERFENGTINYLDIPALKIGLDYIEKIGMKRINERVSSLIDYLFHKLSNLEHSNGHPQVNMFGPKNRDCTGGTLIMNFLNPDQPAPDRNFQQLCHRCFQKQFSEILDAVVQHKWIHSTQGPSRQVQDP